MLAWYGIVGTKWSRKFLLQTRVECQFERTRGTAGLKLIVGLALGTSSNTPHHTMMDPVCTRTPRILPFCHHIQPAEYWRRLVNLTHRQDQDQDQTEALWRNKPPESSASPVIETQRKHLPASCLISEFENRTTSSFIAGPTLGGTTRSSEPRRSRVRDPELMRCEKIRHCLPGAWLWKSNQCLSANIRSVQQS
jgi:hypothetical protein